MSTFQGAIASGADVLMVLGDEEDGSYIMSRIQHLALNFRGIFMTEAPAHSSWAALLGSDGDFVVTEAQWNADASFSCPVFGSSRRYATDYINMFGIAPDSVAASVSATGVLIQLAVKVYPV